MMINGVGETDKDYTDVRDLIVAKASVAFVYGGLEVGDAIVSGNLIITDLQESTNSKDVGAQSITCRVIPGSLVPGTVSE